MYKHSHTTTQQHCVVSDFAASFRYEPSPREARVSHQRKNSRLKQHSSRRERFDDSHYKIPNSALPDRESQKFSAKQGRAFSRALMDLRVRPESGWDKSTTLSRLATLRNLGRSYLQFDQGLLTGWLDACNVLSRQLNKHKKSLTGKDYRVEKQVREIGKNIVSMCLEEFHGFSIRNTIHSIYLGAKLKLFTPENTLTDRKFEILKRKVECSSLSLRDGQELIAIMGYFKRFDPELANQALDPVRERIIEKEISDEWSLPGERSSLAKLSYLSKGVATLVTYARGHATDEFISEVRDILMDIGNRAQHPLTFIGALNGIQAIRRQRNTICTKEHIRKFGNKALNILDSFPMDSNFERSVISQFAGLRTAKRALLELIYGPQAVKQLSLLTTRTKIRLLFGQAKNRCYNPNLSQPIIEELTCEPNLKNTLPRDCQLLLAISLAEMNLDTDLFSAEFAEKLVPGLVYRSPSEYVMATRALITRSLVDNSITPFAEEVLNTVMTVALSAINRGTDLDTIGLGSMTVRNLCLLMDHPDLPQIEEIVKKRYPFIAPNTKNLWSDNLLQSILPFTDDGKLTEEPSIHRGIYPDGIATIKGTDVVFEFDGRRTHYTDWRAPKPKIINGLTLRKHSIIKKLGFPLIAISSFEAKTRDHTSLIEEKLKEIGITV